MEKYQLIISEPVACDLMRKGYNLIAQMPSERYEGRIIYVFPNDADITDELRNYDPSTYYA